MRDTSQPSREVSWGAEGVPTLAVVADGLQQQVYEHAQLLLLAARQEAQHDGGALGGRRLALELTASLAAHAAKQDPAEARGESKM